MTIVVAARTGWGISLHADWRLTRDGDHRIPNVRTGTLKLWILRRDRCIAFSNNIEIAREAFRRLLSVDLADIRSTLGVLEKVSSDTRGAGADFILATLGTNEIYRISNGVASDVSIACIGDTLALDALGRRYSALTGHSISRHHGNISSENAVRKALNEVIDDDDFNLVGDLSISVTTGSDGFMYAPQARSTAGFERITVPPGETVRLFTSGVETGGFSYTILGASNVPAIAIYYPFAKFGDLFFPARHEAPISYQAHSQHELIEAVYGDLQVKLEPGIDMF